MNKTLLNKTLLLLSGAVLAFFVLTATGCGHWWPWGGHHGCAHHGDGPKHHCRHH